MGFLPIRFLALGMPERGSERGGSNFASASNPGCNSDCEPRPARSRRQFTLSDGFTAEVDPCPRRAAFTCAQLRPTLETTSVPRTLGHPP